MTQADRDRLVALKKAEAGAITQRQAAEELRLSERQVRRLLKKLREGGDKAVVHGLRGVSSNRKIDSKVEQKAVKILSRRVYRGFGPKLASEYLSKQHNIEVSDETLRKWMAAAGLWRIRRQKAVKVHQWRPRRERFGELVQWDTSDHDWLEGRGPRLYLIQLIDDATSRVFARFVRSDSTQENMAVLEAYLRRYGRPLEVYTDKASHFVTTAKKNHPSRDEPLPPTQIQRALQELSIGWIGAHSPQAKGRIERSFLTAQDRLVKGMRVAGVKTLEQANAYLETEFLLEWEANFAVEAASADDAHRPLEKAHPLEAILCVVKQHVVTKDFTIRDDNRMYRIARTDVRPRMSGAQVRVERRRNGELAVRFQDRYLQVSLCEPVPVSKPERPKPVASRPKRTTAKSQWMKDFSLSSGPHLERAITLSNANS